MLLSQRMPFALASMALKLIVRKATLIDQFIQDITNKLIDAYGEALRIVPGLHLKSQMLLSNLFVLSWY
jgi:hypothetical protein